MPARHCHQLFAVAAFVALAAEQPTGAAPAAPEAMPKASAVLSRLPLVFEQIGGPTGDLFIARARGFTLRLTPIGAAFSSDSGQQSRVVMQFAGSAAAKPRAVKPLPGVVNYLVGNDPKRWSIGVATYGAVRYENVWKGIDVVFHGNGGAVEYDFEIAPHVDHRQIDLEFTGADDLHVDEDGNLIITAGGVRQLQRPPRIIEDPDGARTTRTGRFLKREANRIGFEVDDRNTSAALLIDPEVVYITPAFGGSDIDNVFSLDVGRDGRVTIAGYTASLDFPGMGPASEQATNQTQPPLYFAGVVARLSADGSHLEWATYLSGNEGQDTKVWRARVDDAGFTYACGLTDTPNFPTTPNAYQRAYGGGYDAFLSVLSPNGGNLVYSTFAGGSGAEFFTGCEPFVDPRRGRGRGVGRTLVALTGYSNSPEFPIVNGIGTATEGSLDAIVSVIDPTGGGLLYSSRIPGGSRDDWGQSIAVKEDTLAVVGVTYSTPRAPVAFWRHAIEDGRGVALLSESMPFWVAPPGYGNNWNQVLTKAFALPSGQVTATVVARWGTEASFDFLRFRASTDGGRTWTTLAALDGFSNGFETLTFDLTPYAGHTVLLQFQFTSDGFASDEDGLIDTNGSAIDAVTVSGVGTDHFDADLNGWIPEELNVPMPSDFRYGPGGGLTDMFVAIVKPFQPSMRVAAIGGLGFESDQAADIAIATDGSIVAVGTTSSATFPTTPNAYQRTRRGTDIWLAKFAPDLSALLASTYFGGGVSEFANGVALDADGRAFITGFSTSADFPLVEPLPLSPPFGSGGSRDYILSILSPDLSQLLHSSKFGDAGWELGGEVAVGPDGFIYAIGRTRTGGEEAGSSQDVFVLKVKP